MSWLAFIQHLLFALGLFLFSVALTLGIRRVGIFDLPNNRSSHARPMPSSGGIAIVVTAFLGFLAIHLVSDTVRIAEQHMLGLGLAAAAITVIGLLDDLDRLGGFKRKLAGQIFAGCVLLAFGIAIESVTVPFYGPVSLGWIGYPLTLFWVVALTNILNFMDGLDGMAAGTAIVAAAALGIVTFTQGSHFVYILCYVLLAASLGFFVFNFPRARIFMGDVGSQFLGFTFAALAVVAAEQDASRTSLLVVPLLFFHFIFDTGFTFCRRLLAGENVTQAHRSHLYQLLNRLGYSHARVSALYFVFAATQGAGAIVLVNLPSSQRIGVFLPFLGAQIFYMWVVVRAARRARLI